LTSLSSYYTLSAFWIAFLCVGAMYWVLSPAFARFRYALLPIVSLGVAWRSNLLSLRSIAVIVASTLWFMVGCSLTKNVREKQPILASLVVAGPLIGMWAIGRFVRGGGAENLLAFAGMSFLVIKAYTFAKDVADGAIASPHPLKLFAYLTFFPTLPSGPMHFYGEFEEAVDRPTLPRAEEALEAAYRLVLGFVKVKVLAPACVHFSLLAYSSLQEVPLRRLPVACFVYSLLLYLDFSGYSDIVIAVGTFLGIRVPENFRQPFLANNIRDFWQRWHITFSRTLTAYIFTPLSRALQRREMKPRAVMIIAYLVTFGFCGFWHGSTVGMLLWGLYHAVGLIIYDLVRQLRVKKKGKPKKPSPVVKWANVAITFAFVSFGWVFFALPLHGTKTAAQPPAAEARR
jgi:D-alanyl-lipoteichoic acid acyltransferase DltB (MBOAT superfamily)